MDKFIDGRFERLERALANLIDSVNKYHPSTIHAQELKAADEELCRGLEEIQTHQTNYLRIQQLRDSSSALDAQIKDTLSSLASTRRDITNTHTTTFPPGPNYPVTYEELLNYARRISKTTMPPAGTIKPPSPTSPSSPEMQTPLPGDATATPSAAPTPSQPQSPAVNGTASSNTRQQSAAPPNANTTLPEVVTQYLNPLSGQLFFPWPLEEKIRGGALASNQILAEQGIDPRGYDPAEEEERRRKEEEERKEKEEQERREMEERERKAREERERIRQERERQQEQWRKASVSGPAAGAAEPGRGTSGASGGEKKQFQFTSLDDLDDDDED